MSVIRLGVVALSLFAMAGNAFADCSEEVADAVKKQAEAKMFRKETNMITQNGPAKMTIEIVAPDRMRQVVTLVVDPKPVETILVGGKAWTRTDGGEWKKLGAEETGELFQFFQNTVGRTAADVGKFKCIGIEPVSGVKLRGYVGLPEEQPGMPGKKQGSAPENEAERVIYLDPDSGRLMRTIYARKGQRDKPIFAEVYSYPEDLKIEAPQVN